MSYEEENQFEPKVVCNKGNMILTEITMPDTLQEVYNLKFDFKKLNPSKVNIKALLSPSIYELIQQVTPDLVEKIYILNVLNENETDICILFKSFGKEVGIKQKYMIFRTTRCINYFSNTIEFYNKDITLNNNLQGTKFITARVVSGSPGGYDASALIACNDSSTQAGITAFKLKEISSANKLLITVIIQNKKKPIIGALLKK